MCVFERSSAIHFFSIADLHNKHNQFFVLKGVDDSVVALSDSVELGFSGEFLNALGTRIVLEHFETGDDSFLSRFGERFELTFRRQARRTE